MATVGDPGAKVWDIIDEHPKASWRERAKADVSRFVSAAFKGIGPSRVASECKKCKGGTGSHHIFCSNSGKPRDADKKIVHKLRSFLRSWASDVATEKMVRGASCRRSPVLVLLNPHWARAPP